MNRGNSKIPNYHKCYGCKHFEIFEVEHLVSGTRCELGKDMDEYGCEEFDDLFKDEFDEFECNENGASYTGDDFLDDINDIPFF